MFSSVGVKHGYFLNNVEWLPDRNVKHDEALVYWASAPDLEWIAGTKAAIDS